jgi:hypothetical protein
MKPTARAISVARLRRAACRPPRVPWRQDSSYCTPPSISSFEWSLPLLHFFSPLNFKTISHWRSPLYSASPLGSPPRPIKGVMSTPSLHHIQYHLWFHSSAPKSILCRVLPSSFVLPCRRPFLVVALATKHLGKDRRSPLFVLVPRGIAQQALATPLPVVHRGPWRRPVYQPVDSVH